MTLDEVCFYENLQMIVNKGPVFGNIPEYARYGVRVPTKLLEPLGNRT